MATVWVLAADKNHSIIGAPLVKAEAITGFRQTNSQVDVLGVQQSEPITVAASYANTQRDIPDGFHLDLLKLIAKETSTGLPSDQVLIVAEHAFGAPWSWKVYPLDDYEFPKR